MASITVNGISYSGSNVNIQGGKVTIDGVVTSGNSTKIDIKVVGNIDTLEVDECVQLNVQGNVHTLQNGSGDVACGDVTGNVQSGSGDIEAGNIGGNVQTGSGDVDCERIQGSVRTGSGDIKYRQ